MAVGRVGAVVSVIPDPAASGCVSDADFLVYVPSGSVCVSEVAFEVSVVVVVDIAVRGWVVRAFCRVGTGYRAVVCVCVFRCVVVSSLGAGGFELDVAFGYCLDTCGFGVLRSPVTADGVRCNGAAVYGFSLLRVGCQALVLVTGGAG